MCEMFEMYTPQGDLQCIQIYCMWTETIYKEERVINWMAPAILTTRID